MTRVPDRDENFLRRQPAAFTPTRATPLAGAAGSGAARLAHAGEQRQGSEELGDVGVEVAVRVEVVEGPVDGLDDGGEAAGEGDEVLLGGVLVLVVSLVVGQDRPADGLLEPRGALGAGGVAGVLGVGLKLEGSAAVVADHLGLIAHAQAHAPVQPLHHQGGGLDSLSLGDRHGLLEHPLGEGVQPVGHVPGLGRLPRRDVVGIEHVRRSVEGSYVKSGRMWGAMRENVHEPHEPHDWALARPPPIPVPAGVQAAEGFTTEGTKGTKGTKAHGDRGVTLGDLCDLCGSNHAAQ